jgi:DNA helicase-2/ATP-dependent DNA helicase PcrA
VDVGDLVGDLDERQRAAVLSDAGPLCVVAPPGSGKTRVLTRRIARRVLDGSADEPHVLALTFSRRAAGELRRRLAGLGMRNGVWTGTFHAVALRLMRQRDADLRRRAPTLLGHRIRLVEDVGGGAGAAAITAEIDWASARGIDPERYAAYARRAGRRTAVPAARVAAVFGAYETAKRERRVVDFDDLLRAVIREVGRDPAYAAALRWRLRHLFVDEFQDVNPLQHAFLEAIRGDRPDLFVVGDPDQAIYAWNGADASWLTGFADHHPAATVIRLRASHRSTPQILDLASRVLQVEPPQATRPDGPTPRLRRADDEAGEAALVTELVRETHRPGRAWSAVAVLARTNAQLAPIADALTRAGVPVRHRAGPGPLLLGELSGLPSHLRVRSWLIDRDEPPPAALADAVDDALGQDPDLDIGGLRAALAAEHGDAGDGVALATFHAAKGLEWPVVIVAGARRGLVPHAGATSAPARAEERRLLYVALTRAERELHVTWWGLDGDRSPFLPDVPEDEVVPPPPQLVSSRSTAPDPVLATLRAWRRGAARAARVDEQVVCTDAELARLAERRPVSVEDVAEVLGSMPAARLGPRLLEALRRDGHAPAAGTATDRPR